MLTSTTVALLPHGHRCITRCFQTLFSPIGHIKTQRKSKALSGALSRAVLTCHVNASKLPRVRML